MDFDMDLAKDESKNNPYFYAQYAYVRCCSILSKATFDPNSEIDLKEIENCFEIVSKNYKLPSDFKRICTGKITSFISAFRKRFFRHIPLIL